MNDAAVVLTIVVATSAAYLIVQRRTGLLGAARRGPAEPETAGRSKHQPIDAELLATLRELVAQNPENRRAAVTVLREHTGMGSRDAWRFVNAL